jgi:iron complex outermembrane receptor protein
MNVRQAPAAYAVLGAVVAAFSTTTLAQEDQGALLEEIVVTGSYLYTGIDSPSPVTVLSGEDMVSYAPPDLLSFFFDNVPQNYSRDLGDQVENQGQQRARAARAPTIGLRGLGSANTLVVLNGRRVISYPSPSGTGWYSTSINSLVPRIAIQRSEMLLDGGSAIFGSDPVAGVVNFVTRNNFRGFDMTLDSRMVEGAEDAKNVTASVLFGAGNDNTSIIAALEFHQEDLIELIDIDPAFSDIPNVTPSGTGLEGQNNLEYRNATGRGRYVDPDCGNSAFGSPILAHYLIDDTGDDALEVKKYSDATACGRPGNFDSSGALLNNNVQQINLFVRAEHNFSDSLRVNAELGYTRARYDDVDQWGDNASRNWVLQQFTYGSEYALPAAHPGLVRAKEQAVAHGGAFGMGSAAIYAIGETLPFLGEMSAFNDNDIFRAAFGVEGDINANWSWLLDTSASYSEVRNGARDQVLDRYPFAISGLGGPDCNRTSTDSVAGMGSCYYYNPFMSAALPNAASLQTDLSQTGLDNNEKMLEWLTPLRVDNFEGEFFTFDARITGQVGELAGGPIGLAFGAAYREEEVGRDADAMVNAGEMATLGVFNDFRGKQQVDSLYFEMALPVHEDVNIQVAGRQENYKGGFSQFSPKIAGLWTPTDQLTLRASWGTSFKGPSVSHVAAETIFTGMGPGGVTVDGTRYGAMGSSASFIYISQPNPAILPQTSENISFGVDFAFHEFLDIPMLTDRIQAGFSLVSINLEDLIVSTTANNVLSQCYVRTAAGTPVTQNGMSSGSLMYPIVGPAGNKCVGTVVENIPALVFDVDGDGVLDTTRNNIATLRNAPVNIGYVSTEWLDVHATMRFDTRWGAVTFSPSATFALTYDFPVGDVGGRDGLCPPPEGVCSAIGRQLGRGFNGVTSMPHWQGVFPVTLNVANNNFRVVARYRDALNQAYEDMNVNSSSYDTWEHEPGQLTVDFNWSYSFSQGSTVAFSILNLFATEPPEQGSERFNRRRREMGLQFRHSFDSN